MANIIDYSNINTARLRLDKGSVGSVHSTLSLNLYVRQDISYQAIFLVISVLDSLIILT